MQNWKQRRSLGLISVFIIGILTFIFIAIYPKYLMGVALEKRIKVLEKKIATQRAIAPVYKELLKRIKTLDLKGLDYPPAVTPATPKDIERFSKLLDEIARQNGMALKQVTPDGESYLITTASLGMNITLVGDFFHFRQLLIQLCYIAFLKEIESIKIYIDNQIYTYELRLILAQE